MRKSFVRFVGVRSWTAHTCRVVRYGGDGGGSGVRCCGRLRTAQLATGRPVTRKSIPNSTLVAGRCQPTVPAVCCNALSTWKLALSTKTYFGMWDCIAFAISLPNKNTELLSCIHTLQILVFYHLLFRVPNVNCCILFYRYSEIIQMPALHCQFYE